MGSRAPESSANVSACSFVFVCLCLQVTRLVSLTQSSITSGHQQQSSTQKQAKEKNLNKVSFSLAQSQKQLTALFSWSALFLLAFSPSLKSLLDQTDWNSFFPSFNSRGGHLVATFAAHRKLTTRHTLLLVLARLFCLLSGSQLSVCLFAVYCSSVWSSFGLWLPSQESQSQLWLHLLEVCKTHLTIISKSFFLWHWKTLWVLLLPFHQPSTPARSCVCKNSSKRQVNKKQKEKSKSESAPLEALCTLNKRAL